MGVVQCMSADEYLRNDVAVKKLNMHFFFIYIYIFYLMDNEAFDTKKNEPTHGKRLCAA